MAFQSAVIFIGEKLVTILQFLTKFDGYQNMFWGWLSITSLILCPIIILIVVWDVGTSIEVKTREESAKEILNV